MGTCTAWMIQWSADVEGDWFDNSPEDRLYSSYKEAAQAARAAFLGDDEYGNSVHAEALHVRDIDPEDMADPTGARGIDVPGGRIIESRRIELGSTDPDSLARGTPRKGRSR